MHVTVGMAEADLITPCLIVDLPVMRANIDRMQGFADRAGLRLRAHAKAHKSVDIARMQIAAGAVGVCCQKVSEAEALVAAGVTDVLVSNEVRQPAMLARLAAMAGRARVGVCVDAPGGVVDLAAAAAAAGTVVDVLVEVDVGQGRCGVVGPGPAVALARLVAASPGLRFQGVQAYHGSAQHIRDPQARAVAVAEAAGRARAVVAALQAAGYACPIVAGAGTGSFPFEIEGGVHTELQCGSYLFMDADYAAVQGVGPDGAWGFRSALFVLASVLSVGPGRAVLDAGLKAMSGESGLPAVPGHRALNLSDEHLVVADPEAKLAVGDRLRVIPGHCDPTVNLHDRIVAVQDGVVAAVWPVTARGCIW